MNLESLLADMRELLRLHPLPWRHDGFGYVDHAGCAVGLHTVARIVAEHGYDIVPLAEQYVEHGSVSDVVGERDKMETERDKALDRAYDLEEERDDLEKRVEKLEDMLFDAEADIKILETEIERLRKEADDE